jgi:hypothetical protein
LSLPPAGPIVLIGPGEIYSNSLIKIKDGSGKSSIARKVLNNRKMTIQLDLFKQPITNEEEFMFQFTESIGKYSIILLFKTRLYDAF